MPRPGLRNCLSEDFQQIEAGGSDTPLRSIRKQNSRKLRSVVSYSEDLPSGTNSAINSPFRSIRQLNPQLSAAKAALHSTLLQRICGREEERRTIEQFLAQKLSNVADKTKTNNPCLYIYGAPGTGKTAVVTNVTNFYSEQKQLKIVSINCMSTTKLYDILQQILDCLNCKTKITTKNIWTLCETCIEKFSLPVVLVFDEIDGLLLSNDVENIYKLFQWPHVLENLLMIGIANSLDLTDRLLPRLQLKLEHKPSLLSFTPYTRDQMLNIVHDRLSGNPNDLFDRNALMLCATKVASTTGDLRTVFEVCRRSMELVQPPSTEMEHLNIGVGHVMQVFESNHKNTNTSDNVKTKELPTYEKILLCSLIVYMKKTKKRLCARGKV
ncbi:unnamed protein product [Didymodactylos carnosus]|nr:unnamed protein product [Didymodactylos carnosus]CAF3723034.1 unnamed protein product [Didymodactylos carnosus]